jgi:hypothetical protein
MPKGGDLHPPFFGICYAEPLLQHAIKGISTSTQKYGREKVKENSGNWSLIFCTQGKWCAGCIQTKIMQKWSIKITILDYPSDKLF